MNLEPFMKEKNVTPKENNSKKEIEMNSLKDYEMTTPRGLVFPCHPQHWEDKKRHGIKKMAGDSITPILLHKHFEKLYPEIEEWGKSFSGVEGSRHNFRALLLFCIAKDVTPKEFGELWHDQDEIIKARNLATSYITTIDNINLKRKSINALKSFYRFYTKGFRLPLDTRKGGACYISIREKREQAKTRYSWGTLEEIRRKVTEIINTAKSLEDKTIFTILYRTGVRRNVIQHLKIKHVQEYIEVDNQKLLVLTITGKLDKKVANYNFPLLKDSQQYGYYTYLAGDGLTLFKRFLEVHHKNSKMEDYVFFKDYAYKRRSAVQLLLHRFQWCVKKRGYPEKQIWLHQLRSLFEQLGDENLKVNQIEFLAGHILRGSQKSYKWQNKIDSARLYLKIQFSPTEQKDKEIKQLKEELKRLKNPPIEKDSVVEDWEKQYIKDQIDVAKTQPTLTKPNIPSKQTKSSEIVMEKPKSPEPLKQNTDLVFCPHKDDWVHIVYCGTCKAANWKMYVECQRMRITDPNNLIFQPTKPKPLA